MKKLSAMQQQALREYWKSQDPAAAARLVEWFATDAMRIELSGLYVRQAKEIAEKYKALGWKP